MLRFDCICPSLLQGRTFRCPGPRQPSANRGRPAPEHAPVKGSDSGRAPGVQHSVPSGPRSLGTALTSELLPLRTVSSPTAPLHCSPPHSIQSGWDFLGARSPGSIIIPGAQPSLQAALPSEQHSVRTAPFRGPSSGSQAPQKAPHLRAASGDVCWELALRLCWCCCC